MAANRNVRSRASTGPLRRRLPRGKANNRRRKNIRKTGPSSSTSIGGLVATGVRTLTSFLPGQTVVRPVVDVILKALGFLTSVSMSSETFQATLRPIGLSTNVPLNFGNLMCECKSLGLQGINRQGLPQLTTNFDTGRVLKMIVTAEPTAKMSEKSGDWAIALVPLKQIADQSALSGSSPNFEDLKNMPGAKYGPANRSLSVLWIPNVTRDSTAAFNQNFGNYTGFCYLMMAYSQEARSSYGNFSPDAFSVRFLVKTFAHFDERLPANDFTAGSSAVILQPNAIQPSSQYRGTFKGRSFDFEDIHVTEMKDHLKVTVTRREHPELFSKLQAVVHDDRLLDGFENISVLSD